MSSTQDQPYINIRGSFSLGPGTNVWTERGVTFGVARLGDADITFHSPAQVRALIAYLAGLAGEMDAEITRQRQPADEPDPAIVCSRCGAADVPTVIGDDGEPRCYNHPKCAGRVAARDAEAAQVTA